MTVKNYGAKLQTLNQTRKYFNKKVTLKKLNDIFCCFSIVNKQGTFWGIANGKKQKKIHPEK